MQSLFRSLAISLIPPTSLSVVHCFDSCATQSNGTQQRSLAVETKRGESATNLGQQSSSYRHDVRVESEDVAVESEEVD